ncbi:unnamed protein product [Mytilus coruscus]|uniref:MAM domain-containing protein n=1 Tax=Mytilus coruscus TaxID=42192 RepID=A0A6J8A5C0_MYTCO|nr:unnamed protein product [Mytilus coruscus]
MTKIILVCVVLLYFCKTVDSLKCLDCPNVAQPYDCTTVTDCGQHGECYTEQEITDDGNVYFNVGCKDESLCQIVETTNILGQTRYTSGCAHKSQCVSWSDNSNDCTGTRCCSQQLCNTKCDNAVVHTNTIPMQTHEARTTSTTSNTSTTTTPNMNCDFDDANICSWSHGNPSLYMEWTFLSNHHNPSLPVHDHTSREIGTNIVSEVFALPTAVSWAVANYLCREQFKEETKLMIRRKSVKLQQHFMHIRYQLQKDYRCMRYTFFVTLKVSTYDKTTPHITTQEEITTTKITMTPDEVAINYQTLVANMDTAF